MVAEGENSPREIVASFVAFQIGSSIYFFNVPYNELFLPGLFIDTKYS